MHETVKLLDGSAVGLLFMGAELDKFLVALLTGVLPDVVLLAETQWANDGQWHLAHAELGGHGGEMSLEGKVH